MMDATYVSNEDNAFCEDDAAQIDDPANNNIGNDNVECYEGDGSDYRGF
jgi:hypothetical protein